MADSWPLDGATAYVLPTLVRGECWAGQSGVVVCDTKVPGSPSLNLPTEGVCTRGVSSRQHDHEDTQQHSSYRMLRAQKRGQPWPALPSFHLPPLHKDATAVLSHAEG